MTENLGLITTLLMMVPLCLRAITPTISSSGGKWKLKLQHVAAGAIVTISALAGVVYITQSGSTVTVNIPGTLMVPGTGWTGSTDPGSAIGTGAASTENAIAHWDAAQNQVFTSTFYVGVAAFHSRGIDHVEFSVNNGAWVSISGPSGNPQTVNSSGVGVSTDVAGRGTYVNGLVDYYAGLRASDFADGTPAVVRAKIIPVAGQPIVLEDLTLYPNSGGTIPHYQCWVDSANGSDSNDGTQAHPFQTLLAATRNHFLNGNGDTINTADMAHTIINLQAGNYVIADDPFSHPDYSGQVGYTTIQPAQGVSRSSVVLDRADSNFSGLRCKSIRYKNLTFTCVTGTEPFQGSTTNLWIDGCALVGAGKETPFEFFGVGYTYLALTNSELSASHNGIWAANLALNCKLDGILSDSFEPVCGMIANCESINVADAFVGTNLTVDATDNTVVSFDGYTARSGITYTSYTLDIAAGTGWTPGSYSVVSRSGTKLKLDRSPAAVNTTGGHWTLFTGAHGDAYQLVDQSSTNTILYGLYYPNNRTGGGQGITGGSLITLTKDYAVVNCDFQADETVLEWSSPLTNFYCLNTKLQGTATLFAPSPDGNYVGQNVVFEGDTFLDQAGTPSDGSWLEAFSGVTVK